MWRQMKTATNYVKISAVGNYPEKFLNMCRYKGILIWNINKTDDGIEGYISKNDFMKILNYSKILNFAQTTTNTK